MKIKSDTEYMLNCAMIEEGESFDFISAYNLGADIFCEEKNGELNFLHLTYDDCIDSILENGFRKGDGTLGCGLYVVDLNDSKSVKSLLNFYADLCDGCDNMVFVKGNYNGNYVRSLKAIKECFDYTEGFIFLENVSRIEICSYEVVKVSDIPKFLSNILNRCRR